MFDGSVMLATWWWEFSRFIYVLAVIGVFALFFVVRTRAKRNGFGWISFLPVLIPAVPTAVIVYGIIRFQIRYGSCLSEDGCMDEASGPAVVGFIATVVVFAICLAFELSVQRARKQKARLSLSTESAPGHPTADPASAGIVKGILLPGLGLLFIGGVAAYLAMSAANILFLVMNSVTGALFRFEYSEWMMRLIVIAPFALAYVYIGRSKMSSLAKGVAWAALLEVVLFSGWAVFVDVPFFRIAVAVATVVASTVLGLLFKKPWSYHGATIVAAVAALFYMLS